MSLMCVCCIEIENTCKVFGYAVEYAGWNWRAFLASLLAKCRLGSHIKRRLRILEKARSRLRCRQRRGRRVERRLFVPSLPSFNLLTRPHATFRYLFLRRQFRYRSHACALLALNWIGHTSLILTYPAEISYSFMYKLLFFGCWTARASLQMIHLPVTFDDWKHRCSKEAMEDGNEGAFVLKTS